MAKKRAGKESWIRGIKDADLKVLLAERAKRDPGTAPFGRKKKGTASGVIFMRPPCDGADCPEQDDPPPNDPCRGQSWMWPPDLAVQLHTQDRKCPSASDLERIREALGGGLSSFQVPDPDVRVSCRLGKVSIRIWRTRVKSASCSDLARERTPVPDLAPGGAFGFFVNSNFIRRLADDAFQNVPKTRAASKGQPDPNGPIHLTGLSVGFVKPNIIETRILGYDDRPAPDVSFMHTVSETLKAGRNFEQEQGTSYSVFDQIVAAAIGIVLVGLCPQLLPAVAFTLFGDVETILDPPGDGPPQGGVGASILGALPIQISLPQTGGILPPVLAAPAPGGPRGRFPDTVSTGPDRKKIVFTYAAPSVDERGLFVEALGAPVPRTPVVEARGPGRVFIRAGGSEASGVYRARATDFFGSLSVRWTAGPDVIVHNPEQPATKVTFRRGFHGPGTSFDQSVTVRVTDSEGTSVTASRSVTITVGEA